VQPVYKWLVDHLKGTGRIDEIDAIILQKLIENSRESIRAIADEAKVSRPTVYDRIKILEDNGIIDYYTTQINYNQSGLPVTAFILVGYDPNREDGQSGQKGVAARLSELAFVKRVHIITGNYDFIVEVAIDHMNTLADLIIEQIRDIKGVGNTVTNVSFGTYQNGIQINKPERSGIS